MSGTFTIRSRHLVLWLACLGLLGWLPGVAWAQQPTPPKVACVPPDILLIVDLSGSMTWGVDGTAHGRPTKIEALRLAYEDILKKFENKARFGLITFRSRSTGQRPTFNCNTCKGCSMCPGEAPWVQVNVAVGENTAKRCIQALNSLRPEGCTPTFPALQAALGHYKSHVIPKDAEKKRPRFVIMMTDGIPNVGCPNNSWTCTNPASHAPCGRYLNDEIGRMRKLYAGGQTHDIKTFVIGFGKQRYTTEYICGTRCPVRMGNIDPVLLDNMAKAGGTQKYFPVSDLAQLKKALDSIIEKARSTEVCDGLDNDCDGKADEDLKQPCAGACSEGYRPCVNGEWGKCTAPAEKSEETCNGIDDNCDGKVDNGLKQECSAECGRGVKVCNKGKWSKCQNDPTQEYEECNGKDDDCDGEVDEKLSRPCTTACGKGRQACIQGDWSTCSAPRPHAEVCDGKDNDCDGTTDEDTSCKGKCIDGLCRAPCNTHECPSGFLCGEDKLCHPKPCAPSCGKGQVCKLGSCVSEDCSAAGSRCLPQEICVEKRCVPDPCQGIACAKDRFCVAGECRLSCAGIQCPQGDICKAGKCEKDPCGLVSCLLNEVCREGQCVAHSCQKDADCGSKRSCRGGRCIGQRCEKVRCPSGLVCMEGDCYDADHPSLKPVPPPAVPGGFAPRDDKAPACGCSSTPSEHLPTGVLLCLALLLTLHKRRKHRR